VTLAKETFADRFFLPSAIGALPSAPSTGKAAGSSSDGSPYRCGSWVVLHRNIYNFFHLMSD
jgi:hypothetical protein